MIHETDSELPTAESRPKRRWSWVWLLPILAIISAVSLIYASVSQRGVPLFLTFQQGHGIKVGDALRYRGIEIGHVQSVQLTKDLTAVQLEVRLTSSAQGIAREGSRFWIVRPQIDVSGIYGLDTMIGANYVSVLPGQGDYQIHFTGLDTPPFLNEMEAGGLEIVLRTVGRGDLRHGAPVSYREVVIGSILNVDLAKDASAVEVRIYIEPRYANLIREDVRFWKAGGAQLQAGWLSGISWRLESLKSLLAGGVTLAIPPQPGKLVASGHRFELSETPETEWLAWTPYLAIQQPYAQTATERPQPLLASLRWEYAGYFNWWQTGERQGWVLPVAEGLLGPADLLTPVKEAQKDTTFLAIGEMELLLGEQAKEYAPGVVILPYSNDSYTPWPRTRQRAVSEPEDTLVVTSFTEAARFVTADHYQKEAEHWLVDLAFSADWHGACVVSASNGDLIGILLVEKEQTKVTLFTKLAE